MNLETEDFGSIVMKLARQYRHAREDEARALKLKEYERKAAAIRELKPFWIALMQIQKECWDRGWPASKKLIAAFIRFGPNTPTLPTWAEIVDLPSSFCEMVWFWESGNHSHKLTSDGNGLFSWDDRYAGKMRFDKAPLEEVLPAFLEYWAKALSRLSSVKL